MFAAYQCGYTPVFFLLRGFSKTVNKVIILKKSYWHDGSGCGGALSRLYLNRCAGMESGMV